MLTAFLHPGKAVGMKIVGIEGLSPEDLDRELENGGRFVIYTWAVSIVVLSFKRPSSIIFVRGGQSRAINLNAAFGHACCVASSSRTSSTHRRRRLAAVANCGV